MKKFFRPIFPLSSNMKMSGNNILKESTRYFDNDCAKDIIFSLGP